MLSKIFLALSTLLLASSVLLGVGVSGASWSHRTSTPVAVTAAPDWTPPVVTVSPLPAAVQGTVTLTATASDAKSSVASVSMETLTAGSSTWLPAIGCSSSGANPLTYTCVVDSTRLPEGAFRVRATATDAAGLSATSATVDTTIANSARAVLAPLAAAIRGTVPVRGDLTGVPGSLDLFLEYATGGSWAQLNNGCTAKAPTIQCGWVTTALADGVYDVRLRAASGHTDTRSGVIIDNTAPSTAEVVVPGGLLTGTVTLAANAVDATSGVASVQFQYRTGAGGWQSCGTDSAAPYSCDLDTTKLTTGASYDLRVVVTDRADNTTTSTTVAGTVDNTPLVVSITSPVAGAVVDGTVAVDVNASAPGGVKQVRVDYRSTPNGTFAPVCTDTTAPYSCAWNTSLLTGSYELQAVMTRNQGGDVTSASRPVTVDHTASVAITSPAGGATVRNQTSVAVAGSFTVHQAVSSITLTATPVSPIGTPTTTTCSVATNTFSCAWSTSAIVYGQYDLQVRMTKADGTIVTSATSRVTVDNVVASVNVTSPAASSYVGGTTTLTATATSNAGVTGVRFEVSGNGGATWSNPCTAAPVATGSTYSCAWNTSAITYGAYQVRAVMAQGLTVPDLASAPVATTVDNRVLAGYDVDAANGGVAGTVDAGDRVVLTYTGLVNPGSIQPGLTYGSAVPVTVTLAANQGNSADTLTFGTANLGTVTMSARLLKNNRVVTYASTMTATLGADAQGNPVTVVTVTLGAPSSTNDLSTNVGDNTMTWAPAAVTDMVGRSALTTGVTERTGTGQDF